jgi:hypothetical protein
MTRRTNRRGVIIVPIVESTLTTPSSSTYPSAYPSEDDTATEKTTATKPFPFLRLPSELRNKIYSMVFAAAPSIIDLDPSTFRIIQRQHLFAIFRVCWQIYEEASHNFFSTHTFRIFPTYPGKYFKTNKPLLTRLPARYRASLTSLDLRLGPGWGNPPRGWIVNDALGLADCTRVRTLKVFVECDTSDPMYNGYRKRDGYYEEFSAELLDGILKGVPSVEVVEFDAYSAVKRTGPMMSGLGEVVTRYDKIVSWGPERGWGLESDQLDAVLLNGEGKLKKVIAVFS